MKKLLLSLLLVIIPISAFGQKLETTPLETAVSLWDVKFTAPLETVTNWAIADQKDQTTILPIKLTPIDGNGVSCQLQPGAWMLIGQSKLDGFEFTFNYKFTLNNKTPALPPTVIATANPKIIQAGQYSIIKATVNPPTSKCTFDGKPVVLSLAGTWEQIIVPTKTTTYTFTAQSPNGPTTTTNVIVVVSEKPQTPTITKIEPTNGEEAGGTVITITGTNLTNTKTVNFGTANAISFSIDTDTKITAISPAGNGSVDIKIVADGGTAISPTKFVYDSPLTPPIPTTYPHVVIIEETGGREKLSDEDLCAMLNQLTTGVKGYVSAKAPTGKNPGFRRYDEDQEVSRDPDYIAAMARPRQSVPWIIASDGKQGFEGPFTASSVDQLVEMWGPVSAPQALFERTNREATDDELKPPPGKATGLLPRKEHPRFSAQRSVPAIRSFGDVFTVIPRSKWPEMIKVRDTAGAWPADACNFKCRDQDGTSFCWANGPCAAIDIVRSQMGLPWVEVSAASVACKINGFVNRGGWGVDAVKYLASTGGCASSMWPNTAISRQYDNSTTMADRPNRMALEWIDLDAGKFDQLATALLLGYPVAVGYNWWRHEVVAVRLVETSPGVFGVEIRNSWGDWGNKNRWGQSGFSVLSEHKATPDDAQLLRAVTASIITPNAQGIGQSSMKRNFTHDYVLAP